MTKVTVHSQEGFHARPAANFCKQAKNYEGTIALIKEDGSRFDGKSLISILSAQISHGEVINLEADDPKAEAELATLIEAMA